MIGESEYTRALRPIPGFRNTYFINSDGRIYRRKVKLLRLRNGLRRHVLFKELMPQVGNNNCLIISLSLNGKAYTRSVNKLLRLSFPNLPSPIR